MYMYATGLSFNGQAARHPLTRVNRQRFTTALLLLATVFTTGMRQRC